MSYESKAEPIKIGYLFDSKLPDSFPQTLRADVTDSLGVVFNDRFQQGLIDRPALN